MTTLPVVSQFENLAKQVGIAGSQKQVLRFAQDDNGLGLSKLRHCEIASRVDPAWFLIYLQVGLCSPELCPSP